LKIKNILRFSLFLLTAYCNLSLALGINDAIVTSNLGEPLIAQINITDVEKSPDISCFSITDANSPPAFTKASLAIKHQANGYQLIIKSFQAITEPIVNLRVAHHCDPNIHRDYVVLLDPPLLNDANAKGVDAQADNAEPANAAAHSKSEATNRKSMPSSQLYAANGTISKKKKKSPKTASSSSLDKKLMATYTVLPQPADKSGNQTENAAKSGPYLSISGGHPPSDQDMTLPKLGLKFETRLDLSRVESTLPPSSTDVMDEITAMDNRLALLKTQIISLQGNNEKLKADAANAERKLQDSMRTLRITAGLIAVFALLASAAWLRRKLIHARMARSALSWFDNRELTDATDNAADTAITPAGNLAGDRKNAGFNDAFDENSSFDIASGFNAQPASTALTTSINGNNEDILESVDVLIEYGRSGLAIHLLHDYLADHPSESPKVWLKLLSLIAAHGSETDYTQTVADCNHYYRINMPGFAEARKTGTATIEDFPYITKELEVAWGSTAALELLDDLIYNSESQPEEGFEPEIFEQLFILKQIAEALNNTPAVTDEAAKPAALNTNGSPHKPGNTESPAAPSQAITGFMSEPMMNVHETTAEELSTHWYDALPQTPPSAETFPTLDFEDDVTQHYPAETTITNTASGAAAQADFEAADKLPEAKRTLEAPDIDFTQHIKAAADTQENAVSVNDGKQPKRIVKDSNLIDWVLTDEN